MNQKAKTPDERFLIELYKIVAESGNFNLDVECEKVALAIGQTMRSVKNIVKLLAQANFVKKIGEHRIRLTPHGSNFVVKELEP